MATAYFISLAKNHAFNDGNKRTASLTVFTFLYMNGLLLQVDENELVAFTLLVATETPSKEAIADFLKTHCSALASLSD